MPSLDEPTQANGECNDVQRPQQFELEENKRRLWSKNVYFKEYHQEYCVSQH
jgi:hypothetical protein